MFYKDKLSTTCSSSSEYKCFSGEINAVFRNNNIVTILSGSYIVPLIDSGLTVRP